MNLLLKLTALVSLATVGLAGQHNIHKNRAAHTALAKRASGEVELHRRFSDTKWTWYDAQTGNAGACGDYIQNGDFAVALNVAQYGGGYPGPHCGKTITLRFNGKTAKAVIKDMCPVCPYGGLDLTPALFAYFADHGRGIIYGDWEFGDGGSQEPPKTTTKKPKPTSTWTPPPTTTKTKTPEWTPPPTTTSKTKTKTTTSTTSTSTSSTTTTSTSTTETSTSTTSSSTSTSASTSADAVPTNALAGARVGTPETGVIYDVNAVLIQFAAVIAEGAKA